MADSTTKTCCKSKKFRVSSTVWQIGIMMMLMNISYVMVYSFSGLYLKKILAVSIVWIGAIEGAAEMMSHMMKLVSGMLSDFFERRKSIMIVGYSCSVISKILLALSTTFWPVFSARVAERLGNGIQASPRDAIVADVANGKDIGRAYGLKRSLAYAGSMLGGVFGIIVMEKTNNDYGMVFAIAAIPAIIAMSVLLFLVKEPRKRAEEIAVSSKYQFSFSNFKLLGRSFWLLMIINFVFMLSRMDETFLILRMSEGFGISDTFAPIVMIIFNIGTSLSSYPIGVAGDKCDRIKVLFFGMIVLILSDAIMLSAASRVVMGCGIFLWGIQLGSTQNVFVSLIAEKVPENLRGTGFGVYWFTNALAIFAANSLAGFVGHCSSLRFIFLSSGSIAVLAIILLSIMIKHVSKSKVPTVS
ncbi:MAG: MFS transporter [Holosporales bacterium]|jgi:MFS family permease|nr:MFS transporter [Holosporales bacterium]